MKPARIKKAIIEPPSWGDIPCGNYYRKTLDQALKIWWPKFFGFYLLKIGSLSVDLDTNLCKISNQINIKMEGKFLHIVADPFQLPFANKSVDACLLAHTLAYSSDPHWLLHEVDRVLIDNGWLIITMFNPISILGLSKIFPTFFQKQPYECRMYTKMRLLNWLCVLNFEVLHCAYFQVFPWRYRDNGLLEAWFSRIGCLILIIASKRAFPLTLIPVKKKKFFRGIIAVS